MKASTAEAFAIQAHGSQKYGDQPYVVHLRHVSQILEQAGFGGEPALSAAAWLHDVVEDTAVEVEEVRRFFGEDVADIVFRVTDELGSNRKERKLKTYPKIAGHRGATIIKLCDRIANVEASKKNPEKMAMYLAEYSEFKQRLFMPGIADHLWQRLDELLVQTSRSSNVELVVKPLGFIQNNICFQCGKSASIVEVTSELMFKYSGPGGSNGTVGDKISRDDAEQIENLFAVPIDAERLKKRFYDRAGYCPKCSAFYCEVCWMVSASGYGICPKEHGQSLDPHWSP
jgi:guanosine-3',5'-bis(diphosphate) 3'-pyrophosphohydrolase